MATVDTRLRRIADRHRKAHAKQPQSIQIIYFEETPDGMIYTDAQTGAIVDPASVRPIVTLRTRGMWDAL